MEENERVFRIERLKGFKELQDIFENNIKQEDPAILQEKRFEELANKVEDIRILVNAMAGYWIYDEKKAILDFLIQSLKEVQEKIARSPIDNDEVLNKKSQELALEIQEIQKIKIG